MGNLRRSCTAKLRVVLLKNGVPHVCELCGLFPEWKGKPLVLQVDHIDGDKNNDDFNNLRFLCPNCHSQTEDFGGRSAGKKSLIRC